MRAYIHTISKRISIALSMMVCIVAFSACQSGQPAVSDKAEKVDWNVMLIITGGIAGENKEIIVDHTGKAQLINNRTQQSRTSRLSAGDLHSIAELVKNHPRKIKRSKMTAKCRDCYYYVINVQYADKTTRQRANDIDMDEKLQELIRALKKVAPKPSQPDK